jgi:HAE1 family hydrophobic/amphiphilic exporter-1
MLIGTIALLFVTPALFVVFQFIEERLSPNKHKREMLEEIE